MGSFGGPEVCGPFGFYLLNKIKPLLAYSNVGLCREDGLTIVHKANGPKFDKFRKDIISLFKDEGLSITIDTNLIETDFLNVSFNLQETGNTFLSRNRITHLYTYIQSPTIHCQLSSNALNDQEMHFKPIL